MHAIMYSLYMHATDRAIFNNHTIIFFGTKKAGAQHAIAM